MTNEPAYANMHVGLFNFMSEYNHQEFLRPINHADDDIMLDFLAEISTQNPTTVDMYRSAHGQYISVYSTDNHTNPSASDTEVNTYYKTGNSIKAVAYAVINLKYRLSDDCRTMTKIIDIEQKNDTKRVVLELGKHSIWLELDSNGHIAEYPLERIN